MSDPDDITADDVVTWDELPEAVADALESEDVELPEPDDQDDPPWVEPGDVEDITAHKASELMHHWMTEECDSPKCQEIREEVGIGDHDHGAGSREGGAEAEADADEPEESEEPETDAGNDTDGSEDREPDENAESGSESDSESEETEEPETNYLGEEI